MNYPQNKSTRTITRKILCGLLLIQLAIVNVPPTLAAGLSCEDSRDPTKSKGYVVTILEEQIGEPIKDSKTTGQDENAVNCFRETKCTSTTDETTKKVTQTCESKIKTSCSPGADTQCKRIQVYYSKSGADLLYAYIQRIYIWAASTIGIVAVFFIVLGGIEMSAAQADSGKIEKAKERIMQSLGGLVILFLSALILYTINPNFFTQ